MQGGRVMRLYVMLFVLGVAPALFAQERYPVKPIRVIILVVPGGGADVTSRIVGQKLTEAWGQQVIVDNRPGGNGIVGMEIAARSNPDRSEERRVGKEGRSRGW